MASLTIDPTEVGPMADSANTTNLTIEDLNNLSLHLDEAAEDVIANRELAHDMRTAASVASAMAHWRFVVAEVADAHPFENPAKKELLTLIGKLEG
jgi:hypothetical protein